MDKAGWWSVRLSHLTACVHYLTQKPGWGVWRWKSNDLVTDSRIDDLSHWITPSPVTCLHFLLYDNTNLTETDGVGRYLHWKEQTQRTVCHRLTAPRSSPPHRNQYPTMIKRRVFYWLKGLFKFRDNTWLWKKTSIKAAFYAQCFNWLMDSYF